MKRNILVTSALPYANGSIHLGHLVEYIQTDIWVRFQKMRGHNCLYICADDTHGTPIMLSARKAGISPEEMIAKTHQEHYQDFQNFLIEFDNYYSTNSPENQQLCEYVYNQAKAKGVIYEKQIEQFYCDHDQMFLPDRMIKGTCPSCGAKDQYGDSCEQCATTYAPTDLQEVRCAICGATPAIKQSLHYYFQLSAFSQMLADWLQGNHVKDNIKNKLNEWFQDGLKDWDISRDEPYFGFKIPNTDKYFYVWLDAPVGYIATTQNWCTKNGKDFNKIWRDGDYEIHHFIGKDILYFHALFWPAMLEVSGFKKPDKINVHGFLTVNGEKMSKSRGTFIKASTYSQYLEPEYLRYYYAAKLGAELHDLDLNLDDFVFKVNSDVVGKLVNIGSRTAKVVNKSLGGKLSVPEAQGSAIMQKIQSHGEQIAQFYEDLEYSRAMKQIFVLADEVNKYINDQEPWQVLKTDEEAARQICTAALNCLYLLTIFMKPVIPKIAQGIENFLNVGSLQWSDLENILQNHQINEYQRLAERIDQQTVSKLVGN